MSSADYLNRAAKVAVLRDYATRYPRATMIETGLWNGHGSGMDMLDLFDRYVVIDSTASNIVKARRECPPAEIHYGSSVEALPLILACEDAPAFFWLDAHYWADPNEWPDGETGCPLLQEIATIRAWPHAYQSVVLIDDIRQMGIETGWPTLDEVRDVIGPVWHVEEAADIIRLTPQ